MKFFRIVSVLILSSLATISLASERKRMSTSPIFCTPYVKGAIANGDLILTARLSERLKALYEVVNTIGDLAEPGQPLDPDRLLNGKQNSTILTDLQQRLARKIVDIQFCLQPVYDGEFNGVEEYNNLFGQPGSYANEYYAPFEAPRGDD